MAKGSSIVGSVALGGVLVALVLRATTLHSVNGAPLVYRVVSNVNDLDAVEGLAPPGRAVELWVKQRNFKEGTDDASDPFAWCGSGGTAACPSVTIHDASTAISTDPEFPFVLGTIQGHRTGGSFIAAAAIPRGSPVGFSVNVNVKFRGMLDVNLGCDRARFFDFSLAKVF